MPLIGLTLCILIDLIIVSNIFDLLTVNVADLISCIVFGICVNVFIPVLLIYLLMIVYFLNNILSFCSRVKVQVVAVDGEMLVLFQETGSLCCLWIPNAFICVYFVQKLIQKLVELISRVVLTLIHTQRKGTYRLSAFANSVAFHFNFSLFFWGEEYDSLLLSPFPCLPFHGSFFFQTDLRHWSMALCLTFYQTLSSFSGCFSGRRPFHSSPAK